MCGRFNVEAQPLSRLLMELVGLVHPGPDNHNAAPTETIALLRHDAAGAPELVPMRWWLTPYWAKARDTRYSMFNAKAETVLDAASFREPMRRRRCLVPVSGFYEWLRAPARSGLAKLPYYVRPDAGAAGDAASACGLLLAGLWDRWNPRDGGPVLESFAILTTAAHPAMQFLHDRQPVLIAPEDAARWLARGVAAEDVLDLLGPRLPLRLRADPVASYVNDARNKQASCTEPVGDPVRLAADGAAS